MPGLLLIRQKRSLFHDGDTPRRNAGFIHGMAQEHPVLGFNFEKKWYETQNAASSAFFLH